MDLSKIPLFEAITKRMAWLGERQSVLAQNVANADTPGYTAQDVKPPSFADLVGLSAQRLPMETSQPGHIVPVRDGGAFQTVAQQTGERSPNGNSVQLETQMMKISDTANDYALTTSLYRDQLNMLNIALGKGSSG